MSNKIFEFFKLLSGILFFWFSPIVYYPQSPPLFFSTSDELLFSLATGDGETGLCECPMWFVSCDMILNDLWITLTVVAWGNDQQKMPDKSYVCSAFYPAFFIIEPPGAPNKEKPQTPQPSGDNTFYISVSSCEPFGEEKNPINSVPVDSVPVDSFISYIPDRAS